MAIYDFGDSSNRPVVVKTIALIRHDKRDYSVVFQDGVTIVKKADEVRRMLDDMGSNNPIVILESACQFSVRFTTPHKINLFDIFEIYLMILIFDQQLLTAQVVDDIYLITFFLRS